MTLTSDSVTARTLSVFMPIPGGVTTESCQAACANAGYSLAGTEYTDEVRLHHTLLST